MVLLKGYHIPFPCHWQEHGDICQILLGLIIGMELPGNRSPTQLLRAVCSILDFLYLSQLPMHTTETLHNLQNALATFHDNKSIFIDLGVREHFNFPKLHSLTHYVSCIESLGTTDNYNTEYTECLHIDFAKDAYQATNHKDEYPQMTLWLERKEKVLIHQAYINQITTSPSIPHSVTEPDIIPANQPKSTESNDPPHIHMSKTPSVSSVDFNTLVSDYGVVDFRQALTVFITSYNQPSLNCCQLQNEAYKILLPFKKVPVFHKIKVWNDDPQERVDGKKTLDVIHCHPGTTVKKCQGVLLP
jgi:hypothetical protein